MIKGKFAKPLHPSAQLWILLLQKQNENTQLISQTKGGVRCMQAPLWLLLLDNITLLTKHGPALALDWHDGWWLSGLQFM